MDSGELVEDLTPLFDLVDFEKRFFRFMDSNELADCEFVVGPQKTVIKGHKVFFCAASEVFDAMFLGDLKETKPVHVEDLEPDGFQAMKKYIYTGQTDFESVFHALNTYIAARKYLIESLKRECIAYIDEKLQPSQVLEFLDRCILDCISLFNDHCSKIISDKTADVVNSQYFSSANFETIELILKAPSLKLKSELELFGHFERWALAEAERQGISEEDIATSFNSLKKHIRFLTISGKDFVTHIEPSVLLTREEKRVIALNKIKFNPNLTSENISMVQKLRGLDMPQFYIRYEEKHIFKIPVNNTSIGRRISTSINLLPASTENRSYNGSYHSMNIFFINHNTSISFEADTRFYRISMKKIVIKSKFRVIGKYVHDDLHFKRQCEFSVINNDNYNPKLNSYMLEIIPKSSLKPAHYSNTNVVSIEGMFSVEKIDL